MRRNPRINRLLALAVALFLSNIALVSCAMAYALCNECPDHVPALCVDSCATTDIAIADKTGDLKSDVHRPVAHAYAVSPLDSVCMPGQPSVAQRGYDQSYSPPPLHVQFCVFLI
jgi:hypothetical protein